MPLHYAALAGGAEDADALLLMSAYAARRREGEGEGACADGRAYSCSRVYPYGLQL